MPPSVKLLRRTIASTYIASHFQGESQPIVGLYPTQFSKLLCVDKVASQLNSPKIVRTTDKLSNYLPV